MRKYIFLGGVVAAVLVVPVQGKISAEQGAGFSAQINGVSASETWMGIKLGQDEAELRYSMDGVGSSQNLRGGRGGGGRGPGSGPDRGGQPSPDRPHPDRSAPPREQPPPT